jgi:hypothetical protein
VDVSVSEGFDPLRMQAEQREARKGRDRRKMLLRRWGAWLLLPVLIVVGMYAVGGLGNASEWRDIRSDLKALRKGEATPAQVSGMVRSAMKIEDRRGTHAALAGVYSVYAMEMMRQGNARQSGKALAVLQKRFSDEAFFAGLWQKDGLTKVCEACGGKSGFAECKSCHGSGKLPAVGGRLRGDGGSARRDCPVCHGTGKVRSLHVCEVCGGSGRVISQEAVDENRDKVLRRAMLFVRLKCLQNFLGLRFW